MHAAAGPQVSSRVRAIRYFLDGEHGDLCAQCNVINLTKVMKANESKAVDQNEAGCPAQVIGPHRVGDWIAIGMLVDANRHC